MPSTVPSAAPALAPDAQTSSTAVPARPITSADANTYLKEQIVAGTRGLADIGQALGDNPLDALGSASPDDLAALKEGLRGVMGSVQRVYDAVSLAEGIRASVRPIVPTLHMRGIFQGEAHLEEIKLNVVLTLDPSSGIVIDINIIPPDATPPSLNPNQIHTTITASEYTKETLAKGWTDDEATIKRIEQDIEAALKQHGWIEKNGSGKMSISTITPGQIPSSRAWVNPAGALRRTWDTSSRKRLAEQRRGALRQS